MAIPRRRDFLVTQGSWLDGERSATQSVTCRRELRDVAEGLYEEVGSIAMTLISAKIKRVRDKL
jgi:hypothetical protein